jgi:hypothetical protein
MHAHGSADEEDRYSQETTPGDTPEGTCPTTVHVGRGHRGSRRVHTRGTARLSGLTPESTLTFDASSSHVTGSSAAGRTAAGVPIARSAAAHGYARPCVPQTLVISGPRARLGVPSGRSTFRSSWRHGRRLQNIQAGTRGSSTWQVDVSRQRPTRYQYRYSLVSYWPDLQEVTRSYTQHRLRLLYLAATRGWPAAIYFDTHGSDEFIPTEPRFWAGYRQQQPRPVTAQRTSRARTRS